MRVWLALGLAVVAQGCGFGDGQPDWARGVGRTFAASTAAAGPLGFVRDIQPLLSSCRGCHGTLTTGYRLSSQPIDDDADHRATLAQVDLGRPARSSLLVYASNDGVNHTGGALWAVGSGEHDLVVRWIEDGAELNPVQPPTSASSPTYAEVKALLGNCSVVGCHGSTTAYRLTPGLTDDAGDYTATLGFVDMGNPASSPLLLRPTQTAPHPRQGILPGSAEYETIHDWIAAGVPFR